MFVFLFAACVTTTTQLSSPHALRPGQTQITISNAWQGNSAVLVKSLDAGSTLYNNTLGENTEISEEDLRTLLDSGLAWTLYTPGTSIEILGRIGVTNKILDGVDIGLRTDLSVLKGDIKLQVWGNEHQALSLNAAYGWHYSMLSSTVEWMTLTSFARHDIDCGLLWGFRKSGIFDVYIGPRFIRSNIYTKPKLNADIEALIPDSIESYNPSQFFIDEHLSYYGLTIGGKIGYKSIYMNVELNSFWQSFQPIVLNQTSDHNGITLSPVIGFSYIPK